MRLSVEQMSTHGRMGGEVRHAHGGVGTGRERTGGEVAR